MQLLEPRKNDNSSDGFFDWTLNSVMTWGETPKGRWRIDIYDMVRKLNFSFTEKNYYGCVLKRIEYRIQHYAHALHKILPKCCGIANL